MWEQDVLVTPHLVLQFLSCFFPSIRINERRQRGMEENKRLAYLADIKTITVGE